MCTGGKTHNSDLQCPFDLLHNLFDSGYCINVIQIVMQSILI